MFVPFTSPLTWDLYYVSYPVRAIRVNDLVFLSGMGFVPESPHIFHVVRGGPLENLWGGGGGGGRSTKKYIRAREN